MQCSAVRRDATLVAPRRAACIVSSDKGRSGRPLAPPYEMQNVNCAVAQLRRRHSDDPGMRQRRGRGAEAERPAIKTQFSALADCCLQTFTPHTERLNVV
jgi:hypothetical protein